MSIDIHDIATQEDVVIFVDRFYDLVVRDELLAPIFVDIAAVDFDEHLPKMYSFWSSILLGAGTYHGAPFPVHAALRQHITPGHFERWLQLFEQTIDTHFRGDMAEAAKQRARNIAMVFQAKLGMFTGSNPFTSTSK
jgi:hemoglobin